MKHSVSLIEDPDQFVNKVHFYLSDRIDGNKELKDCVSESYMTEDQFKEFEYSATMARFKTEKLMKANGIFGTGKGINPSGKRIRAPIKIETSRREKRKHTRQVHEDSRYIKFLSLTEREVLEKFDDRSGKQFTE